MMDMNSKSLGKFTAWCLDEVNSIMDIDDALKPQQTELAAQYVKRLRAYMLSGHQADLMQASRSWDLSTIDPNDALKLHEEQLLIMLPHVEWDEFMIMCQRSFAYLMESLEKDQAEREYEEGDVLSLSKMREPWKERAHDLFMEHAQAAPSKYENILQQMDSAVILFDESGVLSFINVEAAKLLQVPRKQLAGRSIVELFHHPMIARDKRRMLVRTYRETIQRRKRYHEITDRHGRTYMVTLTYGEQMDGDYLFTIKDVSDFKRIEQTAVQNDKLAILGKIAAAIAHEIRNPLTSIRGFIQLLRPHLVQLGKEEYARIILAEIDRANDIIFEFLNSSKPTAPLTSEIPISSLLREVVLLIESDALMRGCEIDLQDANDSSKMVVAIDVKQIKQVVLNMMRNALEAIREVDHLRKGRISISSRMEGRYVAICIQDNGSGMDERTLERLFDPFFTTKDEGTGLGLSVSYRIIRNHGGSIEVDSVKGEWTEFIIRLPLVLRDSIAPQLHQV